MNQTRHGGRLQDYFRITQVVISIQWILCDGVIFVSLCVCGSICPNLGLCTEKSLTLKLQKKNANCTFCILFRCTWYITFNQPNYYFRLLCMGALKNNGFERSKIIPQRQTKTNKHKIKQAIFKLQKFMLIGWIKLILVTLWHCNLFFIKAKQCVCVCTAKQYVQMQKNNTRIYMYIY